MSQLPGKDTSLWLATTEETDFTQLQTDQTVYDAVVVGGGIAGILTAWQLQQAGLKVVLVEKSKLIENTTGNTTAKLTSQHNLVYDYLINEHGEDVARAFGQLNQQAIEDIQQISEKLEIASDFERADAYVITEDSKRVDRIKKEVEAATKLGLPASFETQTETNFKVKGAIKFTNQAQFHPRKFLLGIVAQLRKNGVTIYEHTEAIDIEPGQPATLKTKQGELKGKHIIGATKYPFWRTEVFEDHHWVKLSYALGVTLKQDYPMGMYITTEEPVRTFRSHPYKGGRILVFGGESHPMTDDYDKDVHYQNLIEDVTERFKIDKILYRWIAGDVMPSDRLPFIGPYPEQDNIFIISGFHAWGLTWGMAAAQIISDAITGQANKYSSMFSPARLSDK